MSRSTPVCIPKCSKCQAKAPPEERYGHTAARSYINVACIGETASGVPRMECKRCGYEYTSSSRACRSALESHRKFALRKLRESADGGNARSAS